MAIPFSWPFNAESNLKGMVIIMNTKQDLAIACFHKGFNCAQAVISAFYADYGLDEQTALKIAGGLGGGFRSGEVCGAVSGAVLVIGLKHGHCVVGDTDAKANCGAKTTEFLTKFKEKNGCVTCRDLLGVDTSTDAGRNEAQSKNLFRTICDDLVRSAVATLEELGY